MQGIIDSINPPPFPDKFPEVVIPNFPDQFGKNQFSIRSGYDHIANVQLSANLGCEIQVQFKITTTAITQDRVKEKCEHVAAQNSFEKQFHDSMNKVDTKDGFGFVFGLFDMLNCGGAIMNSTTLDIRHDLINSTTNQACQCLAQQLSSLSQEKVKISGKVEVKGVSQNATKAKVFVKIMTVRGKDKDGNPVEKKMISSQGGQVQDSQGNPTGSVKLDIVPL